MQADPDLRGELHGGDDGDRLTRRSRDAAHRRSSTPATSSAEADMHALCRVARRHDARAARRGRRARLPARRHARAGLSVAASTRSPTATRDHGFVYLNLRMAPGRSRRRQAAPSATRCRPRCSRHFAPLLRAAARSASRCRSTRARPGLRRASTATCIRSSRELSDASTLTASHALAAELHDAEKSRVQVEHFSKRFPEMTIDDGYAIQRAWVALEARRRPRRQGPQDRPDVARDAAVEPDRRARLRAAARRHVLRRRATSRSTRFIAPRVEVELAFVLGKPLEGPGRHALRRARGDRLRRAGDRDHRRAHRAVRPRDQGAAQGLRHDRRHRRQRRHRHRRPAGAARRGRPALGRRAAATRTASIEETGLAAAVLNHPANGVAWLANKLAP